MILVLGNRIKGWVKRFGYLSAPDIKNCRNWTLWKEAQIKRRKFCLCSAGKKKTSPITATPIGWF